MMMVDKGAGDTDIPMLQRLELDHVDEPGGWVR
jgi:hypothetical protein